MNLALNEKKKKIIILVSINKTYHKKNKYIYIFFQHKIYVYLNEQIFIE